MNGRTPFHAHRRAWLQHLLALGGAGALVPVAAHAQAVPAPLSPPRRDPALDRVQPGRKLEFPSDHGAHPGARTEWWYLTGQLQPDGVPATTSPRWGFQITFFRSRTDLAAEVTGRFAARQLLFAHAALTDLGARGVPASHAHDQRMARWNGIDATPSARASLRDTDVAIGDWRMARDAQDGSYRIDVPAAGFTLDLTAKPTQPLLLQGQAGFSRKGPGDEHASHYYSVPQLQVQGRVSQRGGAAVALRGTGWLDHEWSDSVLAPEAAGWDWLGINMFDGAALTLFQLRRRGTTDPLAKPFWAGGSWRDASGRLTIFPADKVRFEPGATWTSPRTGARYPVRWTVFTPVGRFMVLALSDAQEVDSRASTGTVYWEGLTALVGDEGRRVGLGYLEMTGYADRPDL